MQHGAAMGASVDQTGFDQEFADRPPRQAAGGATDHVGAVIVAAGVSSRMAGQDKVAADLGGRPVLAWSLDACERCADISAVALVVHPERRGWVETLVQRHGWQKVVAIVPGGARRQDSVFAGVMALSEVEWVAVHDAARPFATVDLFRRCIMAARRSGAGALAALPVRDTIKQVNGTTVEATLPREQLWAAQTPQVCHRATLLEGLELAAANGWTVTDEAMALEQMKEPVVVVPSDARNFKLTTPDDLGIARILAAELGLAHAAPAATRMRPAAAPPRAPAPRVGVGYDIHRLAPGRRLVLGGVEIAHDLGLDGFSDADVLLHAIMDALLGAAALGDIGQHFPPGDPAYREADSRELLRTVALLLHDAGYRPANVDAMVVAERPRIGPYLAQMRSGIAADLGLSVDAVSIKATTNEGLGPEGREEGISATATATIERREG